MNRIFFGVVLFFICATAWAQDQPSPPVPKTLDIVAVSPVYRKFSPSIIRSSFRIPGERQKKIGSTLTVLGGAMLIGGIAVYSSAEKGPIGTGTNSQGQVVTYYDGKLALGALMIVAGVGMTVPGILLWTKGIRTYNKYMEEQGGLSFGIKGASGVLIYKF